MFIPDCFKTVQSGVINITLSNTSNTATLATAVNTAYSFVRLVGKRAFLDAGGGYAYQHSCLVVLTNSITVTAFRHAPSSDADSFVGYEVIEVYPGFVKSKQDLTITITAGNYFNTGSITAVSSLNKASLFDRGSWFTSTLGTETTDDTTVQFSSTSVITAARGNLPGDMDVHCSVWERR